MKTIRFGVIGAGGLMGREFASAAARWMHLMAIDVRPELVAVCGRNPASYAWYQQHFPTVRQATADYRELLANPEVDAVYIAVPHDLHREMYVAAIEAGKHLMGEKPFGIDKPANDAINAAIAKRPGVPGVFVRCSSEFPFYPAMQRIGDMIETRAFGRIIEVNTGFLHSSDLDPNKPINWKRTIEHNGEYGVMGDLGMHACHVPFRAGWRPRNVRAILSDIVKQRPDGKGNLVPCRTWDNATLLIEASEGGSGGSSGGSGGEPFPWTLKVQRIAPGQKNTWYFEVLGTSASARWSSADARRLEVLQYTVGGEQAWQQIQTGHEPAFKTVTGPIFEFGFTDAIQQMWAAFLHELAHGQPLRKFAGCVTPEEVALSHRLFTAALASQRRGQTVAV